MKRNPAMNTSRERMEPGRLSRGGFLGTDERPIDEIIAADLAELQRHGVTPEQIADLIDELHQKADETLETPRKLFDDKVTVKLIEVMGRIPCPFACGFRTHKANIQVKTPDDTLVVTPMHAHLIREHGFFQGKDSDFRLEPDRLARLYVLCKGQPPTEE